MVAILRLVARGQPQEILKRQVTGSSVLGPKKLKGEGGRGNSPPNFRGHVFPLQLKMLLQAASVGV